MSARALLPPYTPPAVDPREALREAASQKLVASLPKKRKPTALTKARIEELQRQCEEMRAAKDFSGAGPRHMVALWFWCHEQTYAIAPAMTSREWTTASFAAGTLLKTHFAGEVESLVDFLRWTWAEEKRNAKWRREHGVAIVPLGWRLQFSAKQVVKWRANGGGK